MKLFIQSVVYLVMLVVFLVAGIIKHIVGLFRRDQVADRGTIAADVVHGAAVSRTVAHTRTASVREARGPPGPGSQIDLFDDVPAPVPPRAANTAPESARNSGGRPKPKPPEPEVGASEVQAPETPPPKRRAARAKRAVAYQERHAGELVEFGVGDFSDATSGRPYRSYYVSIETADGALVTKKGVELEKALDYSGAKEGDSVELLFLGKEPVETTQGGKAVTRQRNRWRINKL